MKPWRHAVLERFGPPFYGLVLVADPDGLLRDGHIVAALASRDVEVVTYNDPIAFRYLYESRFREPERAAGELSPTLLVRSDRSNLHHLPYDVLQAGHPLTITLHDLCPGLSYPVLRDFFKTAPDLFDRLLAACRTLTGPPRSELRSLAFIARHVYGLDPAAITGLDDLVERLLPVHYYEWPLPPRLQAWLGQELARLPGLHEHPLAAWLAERDALLAFVAGQWRSYLHRRGLLMAAEEPVYALTAQVDFDRPGIRAWVDTLFLENRLQPVVVIAEQPPADWTAVGVAADADTHRVLRLAQLLQRVAQQLAAPEAGYRAWLELAPTWAEILVLRTALNLPAGLQEPIDAVQQRINADFVGWLSFHYNTLHSLPYLPRPVMGHQAAHFLAQRRRQGVSRLALVVLDGLALDQWQVLRTAWQAQGRAWSYDEQAMFAVLPTVTPIARQALFAGRLPLHFAATWQRTDADDRHWQSFWQNEGLPARAAAWLLGTGQLDQVVADQRVQVLGLVISDVDQMVHGTVHGRGELHERLRHWAAQGAPGRVVASLLATGFDIWLTSDHGNLAAHGVGRPREGVLVEQPGSRVRFYNDPVFLARAQGEVSGAVAWAPGGLPAGLLTLFAGGQTAFANHGAKLLTHGGLALEEVVVPWVHITADEGAP